MAWGRPKEWDGAGGGGEGEGMGGRRGGKGEGGGGLSGEGVPTQLRCVTLKGAHPSRGEAHYTKTRTTRGRNRTMLPEEEDAYPPAAHSPPTLCTCGISEAVTGSFCTLRILVTSPQFFAPHRAVLYIRVEASQSTV
eukprot:Sspe_Gene.4983::Locus_1632_Transcript_1_1_Confidence_1.000_Length_897::g.4983::m.4983